MWVCQTNDSRLWLWEQQAAGEAGGSTGRRLEEVKAFKYESMF